MASETAEPRQIQGMTEKASPFRLVLDQAGRWWEAEEENARRLASRERLFVTVGLALTGLSAKDGLRTVEEVLASDASAALRWTFLAIAAAGAFLILSGIFYAAGGFRTRTKNPGKKVQVAGSHEVAGPAGLASRLLGLGGGTMQELKKVPVGSAPSPEFFLAAAFSRTYEASNLLSRVNERKRRRIERAQRIFGIGLLLVILAVSLYALCLRRAVFGPRTSDEKITVKAGTAMSASTWRPTHATVSSKKTGPREESRTYGRH